MCACGECTTRKGYEMEINEISFKFKIGDHLTTKAHRLGMRAETNFATHVELVLTVIEQHWIRCTAGGQYSYRCAVEHVGHRNNLTMPLAEFSEVMLTDDLSSVLPEKKDD